jgi:hypothetical protein
LSGNVTGGSITATTGLFTDNVNIAGTLVIDDELTIEGSAFGRIEIGGVSGGYIDLKAPNSDDYDLRLITSVGGAELLSIDTLKFYTGATTDLAFTIDASQNATFENNVTIPETPTADTHAASKGYVDAAVEGQDTLAEILANGNTSGANDIIMADDQRINFGTSNALNLRWSTTAASGQGASIIDSNRIFIETNFFQLNSRTGESMIRATGNSDVELYYDNSKKLETTSTGVTVTGNINIGDNNKILLGDSDDVEMYFDGATQFGIINDTAGGSIFLRSDSFLFRNDTDQFYSLSSTTHTFKSSGTTRLTVNSTGIDVNGNINVSSDLTVDTDTLFVDASEDSVGINTANPSSYSKHELVVTAPDDGGVTIASATDEAAFLDFSDGSGLKNFIRVDHDGDIFGYNSWGSHFFSIGEGVPKMTINTAGVTVDDDLTVDGNSTFAGDVFLRGTYNPYSAANRGNITLNGTASNIVAFTDNTIGKGYIYHNGTDFEILNAAAGVLKFSTNGTERMNINNSGNATFLNNLAIGYAVQTNIKTFVYDNSADYGLVVQQDGSGIPFQVTSGGNIRMIVANNGNVGIGTTNPVGDGTALNLYGTTASTLKLQTSSSGTAITDGGEIVMYDNDLIIKNREAGYIQFATTGTERMRITSAGALAIRSAIGTTSSRPAVGTAKIAGEIAGVDNAGFTSDGGFLRLSAGGGTDAAIKSFIDLSGYSTDADLDRSILLGTGGTERMRIDSSGNIGVFGNTSPTCPIDFGTSVPNNKRIIGTYVNGNLFTGIGMSATTAGVRIAGDLFGNNLLDIGYYSADGNYTWSSTMFINNTNVGIGTTSPDLTGFGYKTLTVVGGTTAGYAGVLELGSPTTNANGQNLGIIAFMDGSTRNAQIDVTRASSTSTSDMHFYTNGGSGIEERMRITSDGSLARNSKKVWNFTASKSFTEGTSSVNFFRLNFNGNTPVYANITLMSNNSGTGSRTMQSVQAMLSVSYQGYLPTMTEISKTSVSNNGSSYISAVQGANGSLTFLCDTTNNTTGTTNSTFASVELVANGAIDASITVL